MTVLTERLAGAREAGPGGAGARGETAVRLEGLTKTFGDVTAVAGIDLDIAKGEFFSLLGPSGSGKTTTLRMIAGFELPSGGRVLLDGRDVSQLPPYERDVNTVFQDYALFPHMSVGDNVAYGLMIRKVPKAERRQRASAALRMVHLEGYEERKPGQLSGGQRQRVALARALVNRPSVLLLDEPLGALDLKLRQAMQIELKTIQQEVGITFIYVTHDQEEALAMSDRMAIFDHGLHRAGRLAGRGLRAARHRVRGRLRGHLEHPLRGHGGGHPGRSPGRTPCARRRSTSRTPMPSSRTAGPSRTGASTTWSTWARTPSTTSSWRREARWRSSSRTWPRPPRRRWRRRAGPSGSPGSGATRCPWSPAMDRIRSRGWCWLVNLVPPPTRRGQHREVRRSWQG